MKMEPLLNIGKSLSFKVQEEDDQSFLLSLYASTRENELLMTSLREKEKTEFIKQQFEARESDYAKKFKDAKFLITYRKKKQIGRMIYSVNDSLHLIDIAMIKKARNRGFGSEILQTLIRNTQMLNKKFKLSVAVDNRQAIKLYQTLGLKIVHQEGYYHTMQKG